MQDAGRAKNDTAYENSHVGRRENHSPASDGTGTPQLSARGQRKMARQTQKTAKAAADLAKRAAAAAVKAVQAVIGMLAGLIGGTALFVIFCVVILIAAIAASPFGIFFASEPEPDAVPLNVAISQINMEYSARLAELQEGDYHSIQLHGQSSGLAGGGGGIRKPYGRSRGRCGCGHLRRRPGGAFANYLLGYVFDFQRGGNHRTTGQRPWR